MEMGRKTSEKQPNRSQNRPISETSSKNPSSSPTNRIVQCFPKEFTFKCQDFNKTIEEASSSDIIYCDPPYIGRHVDYYNGWDDSHERELFNKLSNFNGRFILSTWHHNDYRENEYVKSLWSEHSVLTREHFYHVGGKEKNRNPVIEALVTNFNAVSTERKESQIQYMLLEPTAKYGTAA